MKEMFSANSDHLADVNTNATKELYLWHGSVGRLTTEKNAGKSATVEP
ncbi:MAG: hypothetical protein ABIJ53_07815 [Verrucomicrobiota bacterium]